MSGAVVVYAAYVLLAVGVITSVGMMLRRDGRVFLDDVYRDRPDIGSTVGSLILTGYVMFTLGYALLLLRIEPGVSAVGALRASARHFGTLLLTLGVLHSLTMLILLRVRRRAVDRRLGIERSGRRRRR